MPESLSSSTSPVSISILLGMNKSTIRVTKQNWAGQMKVILMACVSDLPVDGKQSPGWINLAVATMV